MKKFKNKSRYIKIGVISDTHGKLDNRVFAAFDDVELIIHCGDIGNINIITELSAIAPVYAVRGNMDSFPICEHYQDTEILSIAGKKFCITHSHIIPGYDNRIGHLYELFKDEKPDVVLFGHTHRPICKEENGIVFLNPGSISRPGPDSHPSVGLVEVKRDEITGKIEFFKR